jgi:hypothetical protein
LIKIFKKPAGSVRFRFYKPKTEKTESDPNRKKNRAKPKKPSQKQKNRAKTEKTGLKPSQTKKTKSNQFEQVFDLKNRTEPNQNRSV